MVAQPMAVESPWVRLARSGSGSTLCRGCEEPARMAVSLFDMPRAQDISIFAEGPMEYGREVLHGIASGLDVHAALVVA